MSPAATLELELFFCRKEDINLGTIRTIFRRACLTERLYSIKYRCKAVLCTNLFPGAGTPVSAELWPGYQLPLNPTFWGKLFFQDLVELQITVKDCESALRQLKSALSASQHICEALRCLQVDSAEYKALPMHAVNTFLNGLKLPCLRDLGFFGGVEYTLHSGSAWPQKEHLPMLQSFGRAQQPNRVYSLDQSGFRMTITEENNDAPAYTLAALARSALGPAVRELHVTVRGQHATTMLAVTLGLLSMLPNVHQLSIQGEYAWQPLVTAESINALNGLKDLALGYASIDGALTGPCLTQIVCLHGAQLPMVLANPPAALSTILVPHRPDAVVPQSVLGLEVPRKTETVCTCPGGPRWTISHGTCELRHRYFLDMTVHLWAYQGNPAHK